MRKTMFANWSKYDPQMLIDLYSRMVLSRAFEENLYYLFLQGKIPGTREGDIWKFDRAKIDEWVAAGKIK